MHVERGDDATGKGWYLGPWNSELPAAVGWATAGIDEPHLHAGRWEVYLVARGTSLVRVGFTGAAAGAGEALAALPGVTGVRAADAATYRLDCAAGADPRPDAFRLAVERGWTLQELTLEKASLEDLFVRLTTREEGEETGEGTAAEAAAEVVS